MADRRTRTAVAVLVVMSLAGLLFVTTMADAAPGWTTRISAASGTDYADSSGKVWLSDRYFAGGTAWNAGSGAPAVTETGDPGLFNKHRWGMTGYDIPVPESATYRVELKFAEVVFHDSGKRVFDVKGEGALRIGDLDVADKAGYGQALTETFDVTVSDGNLDLDFVKKVEDPMVSAISVTQLGGTTTTTSTVKAFDKRIDSASKVNVTDSQGKTWQADAGYKGGTAFGPVSTGVGSTNDDALYQTHRWGLRGYAIDVPSKAEYDVTLHFAEVVFNQAGKRVFDVSAEGRTQLNDVDVFAQAGFAKALTKTFRVKVTDGSLNLRFGAVVEDPMVSAVEVHSVTTGTVTPSTVTPSTVTPTTVQPTTTSTVAPTTTSTTAPPVSPPPSTGGQPTRANTGPRYVLGSISAADFLNSRTCNRQRISGDVMFDQSWMKGQTFSITDCEITGKIFVYINGGGSQLPTSEMPIINIDYSDIFGGLQALNATKATVNHSYLGGSQMTLKDYWSPFISGPAPYRFSNSMIYGYYAAQPSHTEAMHVADYGSGMLFTNVAFVQQGGSLSNSGVTAVINYHGANSTFDGCWFLFDGPTPTYWVVYIDGPGNVVKNSWFDSGAGYVYPSSESMATYSNNRNIDTGATLSLP